MPTTIYVATPRIFLDGQSNAELAADVVSVVVEETVDGLYRAEARFANYGPRRNGVGYRYFGRDLLEFGKELAIELGPADQARRIFSGRISAIEAAYPHQGGSEVLVLAEDRLQDLRMTRRTRVFENASDEDVIGQIASDHGLTPQLQLSGPTHPIVVQLNLSDLAFVRDRARAAGAEVWIEGSSLFARARPDRADGAIALEYGDNLMELRVRADLAHQRSEVGVSGWDVSAKDAIEETADQSAIRPELNGDTAGAAVLEQAFAARAERVVHTVPLSGEEARAVAQARYRARARRFLTGTGLADGDARIRVGGVVALSGLGSLFDGAYHVARVRHTFELANGFRTEFDVERAGIGAPER